MTRSRQPLRVRGLFWNVNGKRGSAELVADLVKTYGIDFLVLAEPGDPTTDVLDEIDRRGVRRFIADSLAADRLQIFHRLPVVTAEYDGGNMSIRAIRLGRHSPYLEVLVAAVHLPSKLYYTREDQAALCTEYAGEIRRAEARWQTKRTVVVGDFNMNPYEHGMVQTTGFHAIMNRTDSLRRSRVVGKQRYEYFYNPM